MPIRIDNGLKAKSRLESENIFVMVEDRANCQDIRPLKIAIVNLMPTKIETETQLLRLLGNTPLQVDVELVGMSSHKSKNADESYLEKYYKTFDEIKQNKYDGMIVTGAPVEKLPFEEVDYWPELCSIFEWSKTNVYSTMHICWGAQAALYYHYGIPKHELSEKLFGIYEHMPLDLYHPLLRGFDDRYYVPQSRNTETRISDIYKCSDLQVISYSKEAGVHIVSDDRCRNFYVSGHSEYDANTLANEYFRDKAKGLDIKIPKNYFPDDDVTKTPIMKWRNVGSLLFSNWINYFVYQKTPYDINDI